MRKCCKTFVQNREKIIICSIMGERCGNLTEKTTPLYKSRFILIAAPVERCRKK